MLDLRDVLYFVQVVDRGGFTAASRVLRMPKSTLSHRVQQLEAELGAKLVSRTSRRFRVTEVGEAFYGRAVRLLREAEGAEDIVRERLGEPTGMVRFTAPVPIAQFALPGVLPEFLARYPKVSLTEHASQTVVDIVGEGYDLALRTHSDPLPDSSLVQRMIAPVPWFLFAGAAYLERMGEPRTPQDLACHSLIAVARASRPVWQLRGPKGAEFVLRLEQPRFVSSDMVSLREAAQAGLGVVALPAIRVLAGGARWAPTSRSACLAGRGLDFESPRPLPPGAAAVGKSISGFSGRRTSENADAATRRR